MLIYIIKAGSLYKIGVTGVSIDKRITQLQTGCPHKINKVYVGKCKSMKHARSIEKSLHRRYKKANTHGEWFKLKSPNNAIKYIKENIEDPFLRLKRSAERKIREVLNSKAKNNSAKSLIEAILDRHGLKYDRKMVAKLIEENRETGEVHLV